MLFLVKVIFALQTQVLYVFVSIRSSFCSFESDMEIDAAVNSAITAGVKGVRVCIFFLSLCCKAYICLSDKST